MFVSCAIRKRFLTESTNTRAHKHQRTMYQQPTYTYRNGRMACFDRFTARGKERERKKKRKKKKEQFDFVRMNLSKGLKHNCRRSFGDEIEKNRRKQKKACNVLQSKQKEHTIRMYCAMKQRGVRAHQRTHMLVLSKCFLFFFRRQTFSAI